MWLLNVGEEVNMRLLSKTITLLLTTLCTAAAFAANLWRVNIPFDFLSNGQYFPSGTYDVTINLDYNVILMTNTANMSVKLTSTVIPAGVAEMPVVIRFDKVGDGHVLKNIQIEQWATPNLDLCIKHSVSSPSPRLISECEKSDVVSTPK
jgi:hypothetical protein